MPNLPSPQPSGTFDALLSTAVRRLLHGEALEPFANWFAREMGDLVMQLHPLPPGEEDGARRYQRTVARTLWSAVPVPSNHWRPRALPKVERNDPCHCGSGRKFKLCCAEFAGIAPPFEPEGVYALALAQAEPEMLTPNLARLVPGEALGMAAMDWNEQGEPERTVAVLAPLFQQRDDLDERHEIAFDALLDAMQTMGQETQRRALAQKVSQGRNKTLATAARCRQASMLADQGDFEAAWAVFQSAQRLSPNDAQLLHLELTLLLAQGRHEEAKLRGPVLAARARKAGLDDLAGVLLEMAEGGFAAVHEHTGFGTATDPEDLEWIALCEQVPVEISPENCRALYRIEQHAHYEAGQPPVLSIKPLKPLADLQRRWRRRFAVEKPMLTNLTGDADGLLSNLPDVAQFLRMEPQAWLSMEVLDDMLLAAAELCDWETPDPVVRAAHRLAVHGLNVLQVLTGGMADTVPAQLHWSDMDSRPLLRVLAQAIDLTRLMRDRKGEEQLARWALALNPNDNHGWRSLLVPLYFARGAFEAALALLEHYPDDLPPAEHNRALALFALGRRDEALAVLRHAHEEYPRMLAALLPDVLDPPADEGGPGMTLGGPIAAFHFRNETRAAWVGTGALAWAKALELPEPATPKVRKPRSTKPGGQIKGGSLTAAALRQFGAKQEAHLRKTFTDYPRLHGLLSAIAWSPEPVMPNQWLQIAMSMRIESVSELPESKALKAMNVDLQALMGLVNTLNARVLETQSDQGAPIQEVLEMAGQEDALHAWVAGFVQGSELVSGAWRRVGRPVISGNGAFGVLYTLASRAASPRDGWRASQDNGQPLLVGLDDGHDQPVDGLALALADLWRVVAPLRQARARGG